MALALFSVTTSIIPQQQVSTRNNKKCLENVKKLIKSIGIPSISTSPRESLERGNWIKLICGASFEDVVDIRNLSLVYTLAGGIEAATEIVPLRRPWVMISVNDDDDLHFRKAEDCSSPCENGCPANAISLEQGNSTAELSNSTHTPGVLTGEVITERCYGCGRCFPVCLYDKIKYLHDALGLVGTVKCYDPSLFCKR